METIKATLGMVVSTAGCCTKCGTSTWIRAVGLPVHSWTEKIFKVIGDQWGGWLDTEVETSLKNHLKWARLNIKGDGGIVPKDVKVVDKDLTYLIPIWLGVQPRVVLEETE